MRADPPTRRHLLIAAATLPLLAGCSLSSGMPRKFSLRPAPLTPHMTQADWGLAIAAPRALKSLDSERIAHRPDALELQYYAGTDWVDRAPLMLQMLMVRSFQNGSNLQVTAQDTPGPLPEFLLTSLLQDFQSETRPGRAEAHITLIATLARTNRRQISRSRTIEARAEASGDKIEAIVAAFDQAFADAMAQLVGWVLAAGQEEKARS
jgi:cholesterol transport system auxiliary component